MNDPMESRPTAWAFNDSMSMAITVEMFRLFVRRCFHSWQLLDDYFVAFALFEGAPSSMPARSKSDVEQRTQLQLNILRISSIYYKV